MINKILFLIQQAGALMLMQRAGHKHLGTSFDNIASHSHHVSVIAYCIAKMEGLTNDQAHKCVSMAVFHDVAEARTGDLDFVAKHYGSMDEVMAVKDSVEGLPFEKDLIQLVSEYDERQTTEAKCTKDADSLAQLYLEWILMWQGNKIAEKWFESDFKDRVPALKTQSAKKLAYSMKDSNPNEWWWHQFIADDKAIDNEKLLGK